MKLKLMMAAALSAVLSAAALAADWIVDPTARTITDGDWTFTITPVAASKTFTLGKVTSTGTGTGTVLDFRNNAIKDANGDDWAMTGAADNGFSSLNTVTEIQLPETVTTIGNWTIYSLSALESVVLSDNITTIGHSFLRDCPQLVSVTPMLPSKLASLNLSNGTICQNVPKLVVDTLTFGDGEHDITFLSPTAGGFSGTYSKLVFTEGITTVPKIFRTNPNAPTDLTIPSTVTTIADYFYSLSNQSTAPSYAAPKTIRISCAAFPTIGTGAFTGFAQKSINFIVKYDAFNSYLTGKYAPYDEAKHKADFEAVFGTETPKPTGLLNLSGTFSGGQWITVVRDVTEKTKIAVIGSPAELGEVSPAYGTTECEAAVVSVPLEAPEYVEDGDDLYRCAGYVTELEVEEGVWGEPVTNFSRTGTFETTKKEYARITWLWEKAGAKLTATVDPNVGTITRSAEPVFGDSYLFGTEVTLTAVKTGDADFACWYCTALEDGKSSDAAITFEVNGPVGALAYFPTVWHHEGNTLVGNGVTFTVDSASSGNLTLTKATAAVPGVGCVDLRNLPIDDGSRIVAISDSIFSGTFKSLVELQIPDTVTTVGRDFCRELPKLKTVVSSSNLTSVGICYCRNCLELETFEPLSLEHVAAYGRTAYFSGCPKLKGELAFGDGEHDPFVEATTSTMGDCGYFAYYDASITKVTITEGAVTLPPSSIRDCDSIAEVVLPASMTGYMDRSLFGLPSLRRLVMPTAPVTVEGAALGLGAPEKQVRIFIPHDHSGGWSEFMADETKFRKLTDEERTAFREENPGEKMPLGLVLRGAWRNVPGYVAPSYDQYLVNLPSGEGLMILVR